MIMNNENNMSANKQNECKSGACAQGKHNKGVSCDVKNCAYHDGECYCCADTISVGPSFATSCTDTVCATFKSK